ncbi:MAG TPA: amidohydrolase family protein [Longimicrobiales bacterium]|nr:amidohydrolase family protein [Longimicrobiales bacterium]
MMRSALAATLVVGAVSAVPAFGQAPPTPPDHYALTNARIVVAPGRVIERGTIVLRDGRIAAVGTQVNVPAPAIQVDASGHTVYAGLIDAASSVGLPSLVRQGGGFGGGRGAGGSDEAQEVMPAREAADVWSPSDDELAALRAQGVTTLGLAFNGGIFPGRVAAVNTGGANRSPVLRAGIAQQVLLGRRRGAYPGTLMASIAFVRQSLYDAQHGRRARQAWERQPSGPRPDYSPDSRALEPVVSGALPVWLHASTERELDHIVGIAADVGVNDYTIVGAQEGWRQIDLLQRVDRPVIVSLDFPAANEISGRSFELHIAPATGEDTAGEQADSAAVYQARGNAGVLARAGIPIALSSYGMNSTDRFRAHVAAAIAAGLSADEALRALTVTPADLLGLGSVAGTIETGKIANLVVVRGDIFDPEAPIRDVFLEGVRYEIPPPAPRQQRSANGARDSDAAVVTGDWVGEIDSPNGLMQYSLTISGSGDQLRGRLDSEMGAVDLTGTQSGADIRLSGTWTPPGGTALSVTLTGRVTGDDLRGTLTAQGMSAFPITARRRTPGASFQEVSR